MTTIDEANKLLNDINSLNNRITQIDVRVQEKQKVIGQVLASVQVNSVEELDTKIALCQQQLDVLYAQASELYKATLPKVEEAETCLQN